MHHGPVLLTQCVPSGLVLMGTIGFLGDRRPAAGAPTLRLRGRPFVSARSRAFTQGLISATASSTKAPG
jgi:hypothetical protein